MNEGGEEGGGGEEEDSKREGKICIIATICSFSQF